MPNNMEHSSNMFQINAASNVQEKDELMNICSCKAKHESISIIWPIMVQQYIVSYTICSPTISKYIKRSQRQISWNETFGNGNPAHRRSCLCALCWRNMMSYQACFHTSHVSFSISVHVCVWGCACVCLCLYDRWSWLFKFRPACHVLSLVHWSWSRHFPASSSPSCGPPCQPPCPDDARSW